MCKQRKDKDYRGSQTPLYITLVHHVQLCVHMRTHHQHAGVASPPWLSNNFPLTRDLGILHRKKEMCKIVLHLNCIKNMFQHVDLVAHCVDINKISLDIPEI